MRAIVGTQAKVTGTLDVLGRPAGDAPCAPASATSPKHPSVYDDLTVRQNLDYFAAVLDPGRAAATAPTRSPAPSPTSTSPPTPTPSPATSPAASAPASPSRSPCSARPELLVLDEPTVGLDPVLRRDLWSLFHRLADERGTTLLISSHVMDEAERCHRLLLMRDGRLLADDTPDALRDRTGTDTVEAAFLHLVDEARDAESSAS